MKNKSIKSRKKEKIKKNNNIIIILISVILIIIIFFISSKLEKKDNNEIFNFNSSEFKNITMIGLYEYQASLNFDGTSIIFFCSNEDKECYEELKILNSLSSDIGISIEYLNVSELVETEKEQLINTSDLFKEQYFPYLIIINNKEIKDYSNQFQSEEEIKTMFKNSKIIN